jgi:hypothetical protein
MASTAPKTPLTFQGDPALPDTKRVLALLDRSGLDYRTIPPKGNSTLTAGKEVLTDFSHRELVAFLWAHGARFEDS